MTNSMQDLRQLTGREFAVLGVQDVAYIKRVVANDEIRYAIHAADGTEMAVVEDRDVAFAAVRQHDMEPVSVH